MATVVSFMQSQGSRLMLWLAGKHGVSYVLGATLGLAVIGAIGTSQAAGNTPARPATVQPAVTAASQSSDPCDGGW